MPREICRYCHAPIRWGLTTPRGRFIPIDPDPHPDGNLIYLTTADGDRVQTLTREDRALVPASVARFRPHAASCPVLAERRRRGRRERDVT